MILHRGQNSDLIKYWLIPPDINVSPFQKQDIGKQARAMWYEGVCLTSRRRMGMRDSFKWYLARKGVGGYLLASFIWGSLVIEVIAMQNSCERGKVLIIGWKVG